MWLGEEPNPKRFERLEEGFEIFDKMLEGKTWAAVDHLTIADIDLVTTVSSAEVYLSICKASVLTLSSPLMPYGIMYRKLINSI